MKKKTYLAFDIDGTIYDATSIVIEAFETGINNYINKYDAIIEVPEHEEIVKVLGIPVDLIYKMLFPELTDEESQELNDECTKCFNTIIRGGGGNIFDNVYETIKNLHDSGYIMLAASNGRCEYVESILDTFDLREYFYEPILCPGGGIIDKTDLIRYYIENVSKDGLIIMVGDRFTDREAAEKNNIPFIGCAFGHAGMDELRGTKWIVKDFKSIPGVISGIEEEVN